MSTDSIQSFIEQSLHTYFKELDGETPSNLYATVLKEVEQPLLKVVMQQSKNNQTRAAKMLGLNRGTLRKKLSEYDLG